MKLARIVASSVSGRLMYTQTAIKQTTAALIMIARPRLFPITLRSSLLEVLSSAINSTPEEEQPGTQCQKNPKTEIDQGQRPKVGLDLRPDENSAQYQHTEHSDG